MIHAATLDIGFEISQHNIERARSMVNPHKLEIHRLSQMDLDPRLLVFLGRHRLSINHLEIFYTPPRTSGPIHVDGESSSIQHTKMNFVYGARGSYMRWYQTIDPGMQPRTVRTEIGTTSRIFHPGDTREIFRAEIGCPSIINAGIPHNVENPTDEQRWCLSLVLRNSNGRLSWNDALDMFAAYTVDR